MSALTPFTFDGAPVRVLPDEHGQPRFVAGDVCDYFGVTNRNRVMQGVDPEDKGGTQIETPGGRQTVTTINESGLYSLLFSLQPQKARGVSDDQIAARMEQVRRFKRWVTSEVLPAIRKTGQYGAVEQITRSDLARMVIESEEALAIAAPKAEAFDAWLSTTGDHSVNEAAKILSRHHDILTGERRLRAWMEANGWIYRDGGKPRAYQIRLDQKRLAERAQWHYHPETGDKVMDTPQVRVTARGIDALAKALTKVADQGELDVEGAAS